MVSCSNNGDLLGHMTSGELHFIDFPIPVDLDRQPFAQRIDHGGAHTMEATGDFITASAEFSAGVENSINHFQSGFPRLGLDIHGDTASIVHNGNGITLIDLH